ncbi:MAG: EAL domain-containing protein [Lachnospiraceae bacterium]|nr:EAL domain-containing protein [Lachnospiraceae bacterium]
MEKSISLDIAALILLIILLFSCILRKMTSDLSNRIFLIIILCAIAATVFDIIAVALDNAHSDQVSLLYAANAGYLYMHFLSAPMHLIFVISLTDTWHKLRKNHIMQFMLILPLFVMLVAFVANAGNQLVFSVENGYTRGPLFGMMYVATVLYIIFDIFYIIRYRKLFNFSKILTISAVIPIGMAAMLIQLFIPTALVEMFAGAVSLLIISIGIQRPEDYIDSFTLLMKYSAYANDMKRTFYNEKHVNIIMLNIGNFRTIQSMMGFDSAAQVLMDVADKIREVNRKQHGYADLYYLDNGRFRMVFYGKNIDNAESVANVLNQELKEKRSFYGLDINLMPFIVLASCPEEITDFKMLMTFGADFHEKNHYTGQVMKAGELYDRNQLSIQNNIDMIIDRALEEGSFQVYYQPIYSIPHGKFVSAEALIRLFDSQYGFISPETLITAAERNGAIHRIGEFVFEQVCQFIASDEFRRLGLDYIEVNLSVAQCMNSDLPETLLEIMKKYNVSSDRINLEITETAAAYAQSVLTENLERLTEAGISFSLDDYGTGYSNMKRVIQMPLKIIKLDKSFVDENNNPKMWIFLENTVRMIKDMNMEIVVEGVETQEMLDAFSRLQCDFIQGYFFSKPIPRKDFVAFIAQANSAS